MRIGACSENRGASGVIEKTDKCRGDQGFVRIRLNGGDHHSLLEFRNKIILF